LLTKVPTTLTGVLQARLDSLPAPERLTLQEASIIGPVFWDRALIALDDKAGENLPALVRRELALPREDASDDELREYAFKHQMLHQVTYATVLKRVRRDLHGKLARWLAGQTGPSRQRLPRRGGPAFRARRRSRQRRRIPHPRRRSMRSRGWRTRPCSITCSAPWRCSTRCRRPRAPALLWRLLVVREATLDVLGERVGQRADIDAMTELAATQDDRRRAHAAWRRSAWAHRHRGSTRRRKRRRARPLKREAAPATPSCESSRSACWRCRSRSRAGSPKASASSRRPWPRRARRACVGSKACA
jgi:hypothetical protein